MRSHSGRAASIWRLLLVPGLALGAPSSLHPPGLGLHWSDPNQLSPTTEQEFDARLSERIGHPAFSAVAPEHTLSVAWQGSPEQCQVSLSLVHEGQVEGTRVIESPSGDCRSLVPALLTVAALLVESRQSELAPELAPAPAPPPAPPPPVPPPPAPPARVQQRSEPLLLVSAGASLSSGFAPKPELGPTVVLTWTPASRVRLGLEGAIFFARRYAAAPGMSLDHGRAALLACGMPLSSSFGLGLCGNVAFHRFSSSGVSLAQPESSHSSTWSIGAELRTEWRLTERLWWIGQAGADVATRPLYFYYLTALGTPQRLFEQRRINPTLLLALALELP